MTHATSPALARALLHMVHLVTGAILFGTDQQQVAKRPRVRLSDLQGRRR